jgi:hypothetical protein
MPNKIPPLRIWQSDVGSPPVLSRQFVEVATFASESRLNKGISAEAAAFGTKRQAG